MDADAPYPELRGAFCVVEAQEPRDVDNSTAESADAIPCGCNVCSFTFLSWGNSQGVLLTYGQR